jgi:hypothetical protein
VRTTALVREPVGAEKVGDELERAGAVWGAEEAVLEREGTWADAALVRAAKAIMPKILVIACPRTLDAPPSVAVTSAAVGQGVLTTPNRARRGISQPSLRGGGRRIAERADRIHMRHFRTGRGIG